VLTAGTGSAAAGNASPTAQSPAAAIPAKPTHVVIAPTPVVAKDGNSLGYISQTSLAPMQ
jgi:hypothetical protein